MNEESSSKRVRVVARVRPVSALEIGQPLTIVDSSVGIVPDGVVRATVPMTDKHTRELSFHFSAVAGAQASQSDVYDHSAKSLVGPFLSGVNCAVLAYGNTSSGKTFTMMGPSFAEADESARHSKSHNKSHNSAILAHSLNAVASEELAGVIPRMMAEIFDSSSRVESLHIAYELRCSFIEVYREEVFDLLVPDDSRVPLVLRENPSGEVLLPGARSERVTCTADVMALLARGSLHRIVACTKSNRDSSRGHALFLVTCRRTDRRTNFSTESQLYLCDLAGSEKIEKTGVEGVQLKEAAAINQSLLALGNVIQALSSRDSPHVPFRTSKLTRLLKSPLCSATVLIVCVSPSAYYCPETIASLRFGDRSQLIKGHARINTVRSIAFLEHSLATAESRITELERQLKLLGSKPLSRVSDASDGFDGDFVGEYANGGDHTDDDDDRSDEDGRFLRGKEKLRDISPTYSPALAKAPTKSAPETPTSVTLRPQLNDLVHFICPLSRVVFSDPVVAADGITYERAAIEKWLVSNRRNPLSPVFGRPLANRFLVSNLLCKAQMQLRFQASQLQDILYVLPFEWVFQPVVVEIVAAKLATLQCVLTFRQICRRFRDVIDSKDVLMVLIARHFGKDVRVNLPQSTIGLRNWFMKRARAGREITMKSTVTIGVQLGRSPGH